MSKINSLSPADKIRLFHAHEIIKVFNKDGVRVGLDDIDDGGGHSLAFSKPNGEEDEDIIAIQMAEAAILKEKIK